MTVITQTQAPTPWKQPLDSPGIAYDLFPTTVRTPTLYVEKARIVLTLGSASAPPTLYVFIDGPQGPGAVIESVYDPHSIYGNTAQGLDVYAALDPAQPTIASVVEMRPMSGCGCGTRVKGMIPFTTMRHTAPPLLAGPLPAPPVLTQAPTP